MLLCHVPLQVRQYFRDSSFYAADVEARDFCGEGFICEGFSASAATVKVCACCGLRVCVLKGTEELHSFVALRDVKYDIP